MLRTFAEWLSNTPPSLLIQDALWVIPLVQTLHILGIAVALLGRNRPLGVVCSALLFGALHKGAGALDMETEKVTRDFSEILQALIILTVSATGFWEFVMKRMRKKGMPKT